MKSYSLHIASIIAAFDLVYGSWSVHWEIGKMIFMISIVGLSLLLVWSGGDDFVDIGSANTPLTGFGGVNQDLIPRTRKIFGWVFLTVLIPGCIWLTSQPGALS